MLAHFTLLVHSDPVDLSAIAFRLLLQCRLDLATTSLVVSYQELTLATTSHTILVDVLDLDLPLLPRTMLFLLVQESPTSALLRQKHLTSTIRSVLLPFIGLFLFGLRTSMFRQHR